MTSSSPTTALGNGSTLPVEGALAGRHTAAVRRGRPPLSVILAAAVLVFIALAAAIPNVLAPYDPLAVAPALPLSAPTGAHLLGTDENGRDVFSRLIYGARGSLLLGFGATAIALTVGSVLGLVAGLGNRVVDAVLMRLMDVGLAFPEILLALVVIAVLGGGTFNALIAIGIAGVTSYARLVRAQTLTIRNAPYIEASRALGIGTVQVVLRHVLPNAVRPVLVLATIGIGTATVSGAALSFLGLGTPPPAPEWGSMLSTARNFISNAWWYSAFPGLAITLLVIATTVVGRYLQRRAEGRRA